MLALRRLRVSNSTAAALLRRGNATLQNAGDGVATSDPVPPQPTPAKAKPTAQKPAPAPTPAFTETDVETPTTQGRRRHKRAIPPQRPPISAEAPRKWNRPIAEGVLPAYDLALKLIRTDSIRVGEEADAVRQTVKELEGKVEELGGWGSEAAREVEVELEKKRARLNILEVQSQVNLPEVRWRVTNAMADMKKPAHRHLVEQRWRSEGDLDLLMERIHQMKVVPDVLPDFRPSIDVHLAARTTARDLKVTNKRHITVEPGTFLLPEQTMEPPSLYANVFHTDTRLYTLLLVDPDVPDEEHESFRTFLHWLQPNVPLSATQQARISGLDDHTPYIPPHPQRGTPYHRYVLLLLPQPPIGAATYTLNTEARAQPGVPTSVHLEIPPVEDAERMDFNVRAFMDRWGLDGTQGGGAHMWREIWNEKVPGIYKNVLSKLTPVYLPMFSAPPGSCQMLMYCVHRDARATVWQTAKGRPVCGPNMLIDHRGQMPVAPDLPAHPPCELTHHRTRRRSASPVLFLDKI
ncbi:phosphatidylethanolamine-binding protein [Lyophyllum atratum]|nr:phosphatidylethanolamine-binding protein [Lyophyllum atratum]